MVSKGPGPALAGAGWVGGDGQVYICSQEWHLENGHTVPTRMQRALGSLMRTSVERWNPIMKTEKRGGGV